MRPTKATRLALLAVLLASPAWADPPIDYADYIHGRGGLDLPGPAARDVAIVTDAAGHRIAVVAAESLTVFVNIEDLDAPVQVATLPIFAVSAAALGGSCVALGDAAGVSVVDVADASAPAVSFSVPIAGGGDRLSAHASGAGYAVHVANETAYITFDLFACGAAPGATRSCAIPAAATAVAGKDDLAAVGTAGGLVLVDRTVDPPVVLSGPTAPAGPLGVSAVFPILDGAFVDGPSGLYHVAVTPQGFNVYDVTVPTLPTVVVTNEDFYSFSVTRRGDQSLLFSAQDLGLRSYDFSDPTSPVFTGAVLIDDGVTGEIHLVASGDRAVAVGDDAAGLRSVSVASTGAPAIRGVDANVINPLAAALDRDRNLLYTVTGPIVSLLDVGQPGSPQFLSHLQPAPTGARDVLALGDVAIVANSGPGLFFWNTANPSAPTLITAFPGPTNFVDGTGPDLIFRAGVNTVQAFDVSNPNVPIDRGTYTLTGTITGLSAVGRTALVAHGGQVTALDFADADAPQVVDEFTMQAQALLLMNQDRALVIEGDHLVVRDIRTQFTIDRIPLHTPLGRALAVEAGLTASAASLQAGQPAPRDIVYVSAGFGSVLVMDVTDPQAAFHAGEYTAPDLLARFVVSSGSELFVGDGGGTGRLLVLAAQDIQGATAGVPLAGVRVEGVQLSPSRPNPFRASTRIPFALARDAHVRLVVFDAAGRQVRRLADGPLTAGDHAVVWDGADDWGRSLSTGIYFASLFVGGESATRKMVRMK
jgi:hypothetical protein